MDGVVLSIVLVLVFVLIGGYFAASELAVVSLRDSQVSRLAAQGRRGARVARLREDQSRLLAHRLPSCRPACRLVAHPGHRFATRTVDNPEAAQTCGFRLPDADTHPDTAVGGGGPPTRPGRRWQPTR